MHKIIILESEQFGNIRVFVEEGEPNLCFLRLTFVERWTSTQQRRAALIRTKELQCV